MEEVVWKGCGSSTKGWTDTRSTSTVTGCNKSTCRRQTLRPIHVGSVGRRDEWWRLKVSAAAGNDLRVARAHRRTGLFRCLLTMRRRVAHFRPIDDRHRRTICSLQNTTCRVQLHPGCLRIGSRYLLCAVDIGYKYNRRPKITNSCSKVGHCVYAVF